MKSQLKTGVRVSDSIRFLEMLGGKPAIACPGMQVDQVAGLVVDEAQRSALLAGDGAALSRLLNGRSAIYCMISTPDEQEPVRHPDREDDGVPDREPEEQPDKDG